MKISPRLRTRNAKFALLYAIFFGTVTLLAVTIVVQHWTNLSKREIRAALNERILGLQDVLSNEGDIGLRREIESRIQSKTDPDALYALWSSQGIFIAGNVSPTFNLPTPGLKELEFELSADPNTHDEGHAVIALATVLVNGSVLLIGRDVQSHMKLRRESLWVIVSILALMAILGFFGAVLSHRRALKQLNALVVTTSRIANGDLSQRVARSGDADGFDRLAVAVNAMLENIEALTSGMQTVVDAVAHDLRRPLTHARQALETAQLSCQNSADDACPMPAPLG